MGSMMNDRFELGLTELVGADEQIAQNEYTPSVGVSLGDSPVSGKFESFAIISTGGDELEITGVLLIFDADPAIAEGDSAITAAEHQSLIGMVKVESGDYLLADSGGKSAYIVDTAVPFHSLETIYFSFDYTAATTINSAAGDNEVVSLNAWYVRED